jgi:Domain of unknown function (DUF4388)
VKAILGRLSELGLRELGKLLTSSGSEGLLEIEGPAGPARIHFRSGHVAGAITPALVSAFSSRTGTFCFRPKETQGVVDWLPQEEFFARLEAHVQQAQEGDATAGGTTTIPSPGSGDPLAELRDSLAEIPIPGAGVRILIVSCDPRPYRTLTPEWRQRGWDVAMTDTPGWPDGPPPSLVVLHLPGASALVGQLDRWLAVVKKASSQRPCVPSLWVGAVGDPAVRHQAILAGVEFMIPAPVSEVGETARWFRDELTLLADRLLTRRSSMAAGEAAAFRDFFLALHVDGDPADVRASLLRFAGTFFARGVLFEVRETVFESVGGFGLRLTSPVQVSRGVAPLEDVVVERRPVRLGDYPEENAAAIARALRATAGLDAAEAFPVLCGGECLALFLGDGPLLQSGESEALAAVLARSGSLLGLA